MKKSYIYITIITVAVVFILHSCATLFTGTSQNISINSNPPGADVVINGRQTNKQTPCNVKINKRQIRTPDNNKNELVIALSKEGYDDSKIYESAGFNLITLADIIMWPTFIIDFATGAYLRYDNDYYFTLSKEEDIQTPYRPENDMVKTNQNSTPNFTNVAYTKNANEIKAPLSWVDKDIPLSSKDYPYRFALIIGNEDYSSYQTNLDTEVNVNYAHRDAETFKQYAINTLGIPQEQIIFLKDAKLIQMKRAFSKVSLLSKTAQGKAEVFFYYAGHGLPNEQTKEPYLLPVDVSGTDIEFAIKLSDVYNQLTEYSSKRVTCFLDCCFSGGARNQGLVAARGVKVVPNEISLDKNLVVFSASSGEQSALGYDKESHGMFTYFLLKGLKETEGKVTYSELADYLKENVAIKSLLINNKEQNPQVNTSKDISQEWRTWSFE